MSTKRDRPLINHSDDDLFSRAQEQGSGEAAEELFTRYHARVHVWCERFLGDAGAADDAVQDIFLRLLTKPLRYRGGGSFGAWLYVVTRNFCLNARRGRKREAESAHIEALEDVLISTWDPEEDAERGHLAQAVASACNGALSDLETQVIYLRYYWGLRVKEINRTLNLDNASGARTHLATAKRKLKRALADRLGPRELDRLFGKDDA